jgi:hypothetical protein
MATATKAYWIQTLSGKKFSYLDPQPESICKCDIVHALSREPRYAGHTLFNYTVGQHSVLCSQMIDQTYALQAFMHDFAEAYIKDIPHPLKVLIDEESGGVLKEIENGIMYAICDKYGVAYPFPCEVKKADMRMMATERKYLLGASPEPWDVEEEPYDIRIECWKYAQVVDNMFSRWSELGLSEELCM